MAQLPGEVPRDQRPPQADARDLGRGRCRAPTGCESARRSTTSTRASRTTSTGTACSAASTSATCGSPPASTSSLPRSWLSRPRHSLVRGRARTSTSTASTRSDSPTRPGRPVDLAEARASALGHPVGPRAPPSVMRRRPEAYTRRSGRCRHRSGAGREAETGAERPERDEGSPRMSDPRAAG
jgi:hypothetical protein